MLVYGLGLFIFTMMDDNSYGSSGPPSVADCLHQASAQLQAALQQLESGYLPNDNGEMKSASSGGAAPDDMDYDPDDLAAAFFAQQAKKQQAESKLPIDEWAKTIHATWKLKQAKLADDITGNHAREADTTTALQASELWELFQSAYSE